MSRRSITFPDRVIPTGFRPYAWSLSLMLTSGLALWLGDRVLVRYALPGLLISLMVVATSSVLCGTRPAIVVLTITALFGDIVAPHLHIAYFFGGVGPWRVHLTRTLLYLSCGSTMIWLAHQARKMRETGERKRLALQAMQALAAPSHLAKAAGWRVGWCYLPARADEEVGGDFYDFFAIDCGANLYGVLVGDVMGKGKEAAAHTAMLRYTVRAYASEGHRPCDILERLNAQVDADPLAPTASLFYGVLDRATGLLTYASGGHEPPLVFRVDGSHEELSSTGPLVGVGCGALYGQQAARIEPGDRLLLMTDGVTEARNPAGDFLESDGSIRLFGRCVAEDPQGIVDEFANKIMQFAGGNNRDDIAIILVSRDEAWMSTETPRIVAAAEHALSS